MKPNSTHCCFQIHNPFAMTETANIENYQKFLLTFLLNPVFYLFYCSFNNGLSVNLSHILRSGINYNKCIFPIISH